MKLSSHSTCPAIAGEMSYDTRQTTKPIVPRSVTLLRVVSAVFVLLLGGISGIQAQELKGKYVKGPYGYDEEYRFFVFRYQGRLDTKSIQSRVHNAVVELIKGGKTLNRPDATGVDIVKYYPAGYVDIAPDEVVVFGYYSDTHRKAGWVAMDQRRYLTNGKSDRTFGPSTTNMALVPFRMDGRLELFELLRTKHREGNRIRVSYVLQPQR